MHFFLTFKTFHSSLSFNLKKLFKKKECSICHKIFRRETLFIEHTKHAHNINSSISSEIEVKTEPNEVVLNNQNETDSKHAKSTKFSQTSKPKAVNI